MYVQLKYTSGNWLLKSENLHTKSGKTAKLYVNRIFKGVRRITDYTYSQITKKSLELNTV